MVDLYRHIGSCNIFDDLSGIMFVPNKTENVNIDVFNTITRINEYKTSAKYISWKSKYKFDGRKYTSNQMWNNNKCQYEWKTPRKHHACKKYYSWNPSTCTSENGKYLENIADDSIITCDEIIYAVRSEARKTMPINFSDKKVACKMDNLYILFGFLLTDNRLYLLLLLPYKTPIKTKKYNHITIGIIN